MSDALDAAVVLALATKSAQVFAQDDTIVSFPLSPVVYRREDLSHLLAGDTAEGLRLLPEISRLVNSIPTGAVWSPGGDRYLWDVYGDVLWRSDLASATLSPAEQAKYDKASALLHVTGADGFMADSPAMLAYRARRDGWLVAQQEYNNRKGTAEQSDDPAVKARWAADEPVLRAHVQDAERAWAVEGRRTEIEEAQRIERQYIDGSPAGLWGSYRKLFDLSTPEILFGNDPAGGQFVPTTLRPGNAFDVPWGRITLERSELTALAQAAPAALRARFPAGPASDVERITFEYTSVTVLRPWMSSAPFASRAWRFSDPGRMLSDGAPEPHGSCPAYVSALVLARSVSVSKPATTPLQAKPIDLGFLRLARPAISTVARGPVLEAEPIAVRRVPSAGTVGALAKPAPATIDRPVLVAEPAPRVKPIGSRIDPTVFRRLQRDDFARERIVLPEPPAPPPTPDSVTTPPDDIYVLAFVCKRMPKSPDPDPSLTW